MTFTSRNATRLRNELLQLAKKLSEKYGFDVAVSPGSIRYTATSMRVTLEVLKTSPDGAQQGSAQLVPGEAETDRTKFERDCRAFGFMVSDRLKLFTAVVGGGSTETYQVVSIERKNRKYPVIAVNIATQRRFKFRASQCRELTGHLEPTG